MTEETQTTEQEDKIETVAEPFESTEQEDEEMEEIEVDEIEAELDDESIDELITKLQKMKETKQPFHYELAEDVELQLTYAEPEEEDEE